MKIIFFFACLTLVSCDMSVSADEAAAAGTASGLFEGATSTGTMACDSKTAASSSTYLETCTAYMGSSYTSTQSSLEQICIGRGSSWVTSGCPSTDIIRVCITNKNSSIEEAIVYYSGYDPLDQDFDTAQIKANAAQSCTASNGELYDADGDEVL